ncbi:hypothetical protein TNCV_4073311 [Trichonephila clavipes]|uniref:Uncharacterized protein n=1 Tax=Trichonephila clavipes TaxID=2585209 RepID=A0A8X7BG88_TRICX|nr:hypothetical protein TNCV_4073311 [Trichonephila clavipes]
MLICSSDYEVLIENSQMIRNPAKLREPSKKEGIISSTDSKSVCSQEVVTDLLPETQSLLNVPNGDLVAVKINGSNVQTNGQGIKESKREVAFTCVFKNRILYSNRRGQPRKECISEFIDSILVQCCCDLITGIVKLELKAGLEVFKQDKYPHGLSVRRPLMRLSLKRAARTESDAPSDKAGYKRGTTVQCPVGTLGSILQPVVVSNLRVLEDVIFNKIMQDRKLPVMLRQTPQQMVFDCCPVSSTFFYPLKTSGHGLLRDWSPPLSSHTVDEEWHRLGKRKEEDRRQSGWIKWLKDVSLNRWKNIASNRSRWCKLIEIVLVGNLLWCLERRRMLYLSY